MRNKLTIVLVAMGTLLLGCYPQGPEYTEDLDLVLTNHQDYDFAGKSTYAMPDKIVKIGGGVIDGDEPEYIPAVTANVILAQIDENMENLGWVKVDVSDDPNLLLTPAAWETTTVYYWYDYWYWWYGGYYPGWGGGYYPGWGYPTVSSYTTGTLVMGIVDPEAISGTGAPVSQWTGAVNGILTGNFDANRVGRAIDQAFAQSPYLKTN